MTKKVAIYTRPTHPHIPVAADVWVENRSLEAPERMKRLTLDITESLHRRIKAQFALNSTKIVDEVRELLHQKYGKA